MNWCVHYKTIIENLNQGIYFVDTAKNIVYWNTPAEKITGYNAEEVIRKHCSDNILAQIDENGRKLCQNFELCPISQALINGTKYEGELYLITSQWSSDSGPCIGISGNERKTRNHRCNRNIL